MAGPSNAEATDRKGDRSGHLMGRGGEECGQ